MCAKTSIAASSTFKNDRMWLNGVEVNLAKSERVNRCIAASLYQSFVKSILNTNILP